MRVLPLGGAGEVGASAALLDIAGVRLLIDAGVRTSSGGKGRPLPCFETIDSAPDAVLVTHAHTDHTGALPLLLPYIGEALIHMTTASLHLLEILQGDAVRNMQPEELEGETRVAYTADQVERAIARVVTHAYHESFAPVPGRPDIRCTYAPCGHILGAGMLLIDSPEGRVLWTGDYSLTPQPTIGGLDLAWVAAQAAERPIDLVVTEGTYGTSAHPPREAETERVLALLDRITRRGGKVLIPAFAVGRAQDIVHVIRAAKRQGRLAGVPLYLDGMVRPITSIYENIAHQSYPALTEPLQLLDPALDIYKANTQSRTKLLSGEHDGPAIIISSSGMLVGGRSVQYARAFATDRRNAVLISGYSDEESPARAIQSLRRGGRLRLPDGKGDLVRVTMRCAVGRYHTSAHADGEQIAAVVAAANPRKVALVHGDPAALSALRTRLGPRRTVVFENGVPFELKTRRRWTLPVATAVPTVPAATSLTERPWRPPSEPEVRGIWERLIAEGERDYAESEIARLFLGTGYTPGQREALAHCLSNHRLYFVSGSRIGQRSYRPRPRDDVIDMLIERSHAYQVPLAPGEVVLFSDGSPDLFVAAVQAVRGDTIDAVIPGSSRSSFRRDWLRCKTGLDMARLLARKPDAYVARWLDGLVREARTLPALNPVDAYADAMQRPERTITAARALELFFPRRADQISTAMQIAAAFALAGARALFALAPGGDFLARAPEDVAVRWRAFRRIWHVRTLPRGDTVLLVSGQQLAPTGVFYQDSFEARTPDGAFTRASYRRVLVPGDPLPAGDGSDDAIALGAPTAPIVSAGLPVATLVTPPTNPPTARRAGTRRPAPTPAAPRRSSTPMA